MMAGKYRSHSIRINEAKLMASSPDTVASWLTKAGKHSSWTNDADAAFELNLLARNEGLIDLAVAEHGLSAEALGQFFRRVTSA
jgi:hypothetical protein